MSRAALGALVASWAVPAYAQEEAIRFRYEAPSQCPSAAEFTERVRQRTTRGRDAAPEELARTFGVTVREDEPGFTGTIEFLDDAGTPVSRRVHGEDCDAVVSSLALITSLALDATLREESAPSGELAPASKTPLAPVMPPPTATNEPAPRSVRSKPWLESARVGIGTAFDANLSAPALGLLGQLDFRGDWSLRLLLHYENATLGVDNGREIGVRLLGLESSVCPARAKLEALAMSGCLALDVGSLRAAGISSASLVSVRSETRLWAALGPELRIAWEPSHPFWVELRGQLQVPLVQRTFELSNPRKTAYEIPTVTAQAGISLGVRFW